MARASTRIGSDIVAAPLTSTATDETGANVLAETKVEAPSQPSPAQAQPAAPFSQRELVTIEVNGRLFTNWTSVRVEQKVTEWYPVFQFELTEASPTPLSFSGAEFTPGDIVRVYVGGVPAVFGYITERQVSYDATNHGVKIVGCGKTIDLVTSCVPPEKLNGHDGQTWQQLADSVMEHLGIRVVPVGGVDQKPYEQIAIQPGDTIQNVLERYARGRNIVIGSDPYGNLLAIGENQSVSTGDLVEGGNILRANCALRDPTFKKMFVLGQGQGSDSANGDQTNKQQAVEEGSSTRNKISVTPYDISESDPHGVQRRAKMEKVFTEGGKIEAQITVQGFFKDYNQGASLWRAGEYYNVNSPDLILYNVLLGCAICTYEQSDGGGGTTTLTMVDPIHMNGLLNFRLGYQPVKPEKVTGRVGGPV